MGLPCTKTTYSLGDNYINISIIVRSNVGVLDNVFVGTSDHLPHNTSFMFAGRHEGVTRPFNATSAWQSLLRRFKVMQITTCASLKMFVGTETFRKHGILRCTVPRRRHNSYVAPEHHTSIQRIDRYQTYDINLSSSEPYHWLRFTHDFIPGSYTSGGGPFLIMRNPGILDHRMLKSLATPPTPLNHPL